MGIEPMTSSLPRKRSTPELHRLIGAGLPDYSGNRGNITNKTRSRTLSKFSERETRLELATPTLEGLCSTN